MRSTVITSTTRATRKFSLLGACGLLAITVIQGPRLADLWEQLSSQQEQTAQMLAGLAETENTEELTKQLSDVQTQLRAIEQTMVGIEQMPAIQGELMELARACGCQLRKSATQSGASLTWELEEKDEAESNSTSQLVGTSASMSLLNSLNGESPYRLTTEQISLTLMGTLPQTLEFLDRVHQKPWLSRVAQINLSREGENGGQLIVEANLAFHKLVRQEKSEVGAMPRREGSPQSKIQ